MTIVEAVERVLAREPAPLGPALREALRRDGIERVLETATSTHAYADSNGFLTLLSDGERITGAYALGSEAGEWLQRVTLAIGPRVPLELLRDTVQPFPSFADIHAGVLNTLRREIAAAGRAVGVGLR